MDEEQVREAWAAGVRVWEAHMAYIRACWEEFKPILAQWYAAYRVYMRGQVVKVPLPDGGVSRYRRKGD